MLDYFEKSTKPIFKDDSELAYIKFGSMGCNDLNVNIRRGRLGLTGCVVRPLWMGCADRRCAARRWPLSSNRLTTASLTRCSDNARLPLDPSP